MKPKLLAVFTLIVLAPLLLLGWVGVEVIRGEREMVEQRIRRLLEGRLGEARSRIVELLGERERELLRSTDRWSLETSDLRDWLRRNPVASQVFVLDPAGLRSHPPRSGALSDGEREFIERADPLWREQHRFFHLPDPAGAAAGSPAHGWYTWYWGNGVQLAFWRRLESGTVVGVELSRTRFLADIIAVLPATANEGRSDLPGRIRWIDSRGEIVYQWGSLEPEAERSPDASLRLPAPLGAWRLEYFVDPDELGAGWPGRLLLQVLLGVGGVGLALLGLAIYFYRESTRELRDAAERVSFVNQVSHELKTPLTNIRMYGELLQESLSDGDEQRSRHAGVIVSESERLSRLIGNILTFARSRRGQLRIRRQPGIVDECIESAIRHHSPSLRSRGVEVRFSLEARETVSFDADALEQILGNLFSNVEKYAAQGGVLEVSSLQAGDVTRIAVADRGPGIPRRHWEEVFLPFRRLGGKLTEGAAGTGIGLSIARELACLHGGDIRLLPSEEGASFEVTLQTPK